MSSISDSIPKICGHPGCDRERQYAVYCRLHHNRALKGQDMDAPSRRLRQVCSAEGCERDRRGGGYCVMHYSRLLRGQPIDAPKRTSTNSVAGLICVISNCDDSVSSLGYCSRHYHRARRKGDLDVEPRQRRPIGSRFYDHNGYVNVKVGPGRRGWRKEHRYTMEQHIDRPLQPQETVHHVNGNCADNRLANLELWSSSHPSGQRVQDKVAWAVEFLGQYGRVDFTGQLPFVLE